jgi:hypothetical protein
MPNKKEAVTAYIQSADASYMTYFDIDRTTNTLKYRPINFCDKATGRFAGEERTPC